MGLFSELFKSAVTFGIYDPFESRTPEDYRDAPGVYQPKLPKAEEPKGNKVLPKEEK